VPPNYWTHDTLDGRSTWCRDDYMTTHNTYKRQTPMPPAGFEPTGERPLTHALDARGHWVRHVAISGRANCSGLDLHYVRNVAVLIVQDGKVAI